MNVRIKKDLFRYIGSDCHKLHMQLRYLFFTPGFQYTYLMRKCQKGGVFKFFWMILLRWCMFKTGIQIPYQTIIGEGLYIAHFGNIIINPGAKIGKNFTIAAGALVGFTLGKRMGHPTIGDNVRMCTNSMVIGKVTIGNNVLIAPGAFCNFDVPDNCIVIGNPGTIIQRVSSPTAKYNGAFVVENYKG